MDEAEHCGRLAFIQRGKIIAYGSPAEIKSEMMRGQVLEIAPSDAVGAVKVLRAAQEAGTLPIEEVELYGSLVHVVAPDMKKHQGAIEKVLKEAGISVGQMSIIEPSLEDVFISAMKAWNSPHPSPSPQRAERGNDYGGCYEKIRYLIVGDCRTACQLRAGR